MASGTWIGRINRSKTWPHPQPRSNSQHPNLLTERRPDRVDSCHSAWSGPYRSQWVEGGRSVCKFSGMVTKPPIIAALAFLGACMPAQTATRYAEDSRCGGPPPGWLQPSDGIGHHLLLLSIRVDRDGRLHWHRNIISRETFDRYLDAAREMSPRPQIALVVDSGTDCEIVRAIRRQMLGAAICAEDRLCGEGRGWND